MKYLRYLWLSLTILVMLIGALAACASKDEPARVAEKFLRAAAGNDLAALREVVDPDVIGDVSGGMMLQIGLQALLGGGFNEFDELTVETISDDGQRARVRATGKLRTRVLGVEMVSPFEQEIPLVKKDRRWYVTTR